MKRLALAPAIFGLAALLGCGAREQPEPRERARPDSPEQPEQPPQAREDPKAERKRECVAELTAAAAPRYHALVRAACFEWIELDVPGLALVVAEPDGQALHVELGRACAGADEPVRPTTAFRLGSVTKPITAALALGLVDAGALTLDRDASVVPGFAAQAGLAPPQLDALLRHRSGLGEIEPATLVELGGAWLPALARARATTAGEYRYSNSGYALIGAMIEQASGRAYAELLTAQIAAPLGLATLTAVPAEGMACGHLATDPDRRPISVLDDLAFMPGDPAWMLAAGGALGSAADLARFALAIGTERLPGTAALLEPGEPLPPAQTHPGHIDERYGLGLRNWQIDQDTRVFGHSGNNVSFVAELLFVPKRRAIVVLANCGVTLSATLAAAEALLLVTNQ